MSANPEVRRLAVAEGVSLHARVWTPADGDGRRRPPFLLMHGLSSNCRTWAAVADHLHRKGSAVATVDLRGHGQSDKPDDGYDFATLTDDLLAVITALDFDRPVVGGQSTGGNLALELAHKAPDRVAATVGVDGGALELQRRWPRWEDCEAALAPPRFSGTPVVEFERMIRERHPAWSDAAVAATLANVDVRPDGTIRLWLTYDRHLRILRSLWEHRPSVVLPSLKVPLLLVMAEADDGYPTTRKEEAERARAAGPHVRVEWLAGDHDLHLEHPEAVADLLEQAAAAALNHGAIPS